MLELETKGQETQEVVELEDKHQAMVILEEAKEEAMREEPRL